MSTRGQRLEIGSALRPKELLAAVYRACPLVDTWFGVGEVRVELFGRGETALGLTLGPADRPPRAMFEAVVHRRAGRSILLIRGLERRGRWWGPWRRRAYRAMHRRFLVAVAGEVARADPTASPPT